MSEDQSNLSRPSVPRYRPVWDVEDRVWVGTSIDRLDKENQFLQYHEAIQSLVRSSALLERVLSESVETKMSNRHVLDGLLAVKDDVSRCLELFPMWLLKQIEDAASNTDV